MRTRKAAEMAHNEAYRKAEEKIEEARRTGATELDLSGLDLSELPTELWSLRNLEVLKLGIEYLGIKNQLTQIPQEISNLTQLQTLDLSSNQLMTLPDSLIQLPKLHSLSVVDNQLMTLPEWLGELTQLQFLNLSSNQLTVLPESIGQLTQLQSLILIDNNLTGIPESLGQLTRLQSLNFGGNKIGKIPDVVKQLSSLLELQVWGNNLHMLPNWLGEIVSLNKLNIQRNELLNLPDSLALLTNLNTLWLGYAFDSDKDEKYSNPLQHLPPIIRGMNRLTELYVGCCQLTSLPDWIGELTELTLLYIPENQLIDIPQSIAQLDHLETLRLDGNPLNPELYAAYADGLEAVKAYLRAKTGPQIILNEAKLILVGEGEVGKTCLMDALEGIPWQEHETTHGIGIRPIQVTDPDRGAEMTLNGWDFGGQRVYRPTHQLFFSSPAVYLVVWKPREGPQQGFVREWIQLVKRREPDAKILVVATHGGPGARQPDIDRQELWDLFGKETVLDFFFVDSKPDENGQRHGIEELRAAIGRVAAALPEMGRSVPLSFQQVRQALTETDAAYLPLARVHEICRENGMEEYVARLFVTISHRLGHLIHYEHDPALRDIVVLKPDWLATAISFVLDDAATRTAHGLVRLSRLSQLWDDPRRAADSRYPADLHPIFLRLMERFDLSYRVAGLAPNDDADPQSLIAQLVPDNRPESDLAREWTPTPTTGDLQQMQICRIVDGQSAQSAPAEGLFYQLIVRLHRYSLGRVRYTDSVHWQRGLILDDDYNGRALLEHFGNDVRITVRAPYPERFLAMLTEEVKYLVESFWEGLRCDVMVPCIAPCGRQLPGTGQFEVQKLIQSKRKNRPEYPCPVCNEWQDIDHLLRNAPAVRPVVVEELFESREIIEQLRSMHRLMILMHADSLGRFDQLDAGQRELLSKADASYTAFMQVLTDEAKEGPRLFSFVPVDRTAFNPKQWTSAKFRLTLWCEHSRQPLPLLDGNESKKGVYEIELKRDWFKKAAPFLKVLTGTLSLVLPVASSGIKLALDDTAYKAIEEQLDFGQDVIDASLDASGKVVGWLGKGDSADLEHGDAIRTQGATLREFHALLKEKDPGFGGLVRVLNKRQEFLWVHPQFESEY